MPSKKTHIGIKERQIPIIAGRVVTWVTFERDRQSVAIAGPGWVDVGDALRQRWRDIMKRPPCITGYPDIMDAFDVADRAEQWAAEAMLPLEMDFEVEVISAWYATKDGVCMCGPIPGPNEFSTAHPFQFDNEVLRCGTEEAAIQDAARWMRYFSVEARKMNASYGKKQGLEWLIIADDPRIEEAFKLLK